MLYVKKIIDNIYHIFWKLPLNESFKSFAHSIYRHIRNRTLLNYIIGKFIISNSKDVYSEFKHSTRTKYSYEEISGKYEISDADPYLIAYYLPQFHPTAENNQWWGNGVTEWNNVTRSLPQFVNHIQPRIPADLGYYDLRLDEIILKQSEIAANHGISVFAIYYYWFGGNSRLLEMPLNKISSTDKFKIKFCICWANESWTKRFDGISSDVLIEQDHSLATYNNFINQVEIYLNSKNYFHLDNKPVIIIYRPNSIPNARTTINNWRLYFATKFKLQLHIIAVKDPFKDRNWIEEGFDAETSFQPAQVRSLQSTVNHTLKILNTNFNGKVYNYADIIEYSLYNQLPSTNYHYSICSGWDNTPRRDDSGVIYINSTPVLYREWLTRIIKLSKENISKIIFINAWNEWGEGAYLEPDYYYGNSFLLATKDALNLART
jgi:hypothetical protein